MPPPTEKIHPATLTIKPIDQVAFNHLAILEDELQDDPWQASAFFALARQPLLNFCAWGAYDGKNLLGYLVGQCTDSVELLRFGVTKNYQGRGIGKQLLTHWLATVGGQAGSSQAADFALLEVRTDNAPAIALYQAVGFVVIHRRKNYYMLDGKHFDAYVMQKPLLRSPNVLL